MRRYIWILAIWMSALGAFGFYESTNTATLTASEADGDWDQFRWTWVNDNDQYCSFNCDTDLSGLGIYFRVSDGPTEDDTAYLTLTTNSMTINDSTQCTFRVISTNVPPTGTYHAELQIFSGAGGSAKYRTLGQGKVNTVWSILDQTNAFAQGSLPSLIGTSAFTQDGGFLVGTGTATYQEETGTVAQASMGVLIGTDVQAYDADLTTVAALDGGALTNLNAGALTGDVAAARLPTNVQQLNNKDGGALTNLQSSSLSGTIGNNLLDSDLQTLAKLDGGALTNLNADNIASGTIDNDRLDDDLKEVASAGAITNYLHKSSSTNYLTRGATGTSEDNLLIGCVTNMTGYTHPSGTLDDIDLSDGNVKQDWQFDVSGHPTNATTVDLDGRYYTETELDALLAAKVTTQTVADVDNSDGTVIQDVQHDADGISTGYPSVNLDDRYYTETVSYTHLRAHET